MSCANHAASASAKVVGFVGSMIFAGLLAMPVNVASAGVVNFSIAAQTDAGLGVNGTATYDPINLYSAAGGYGAAFLLPLVPIELPLGGVDGGLVNFQTKLNAAQNGGNAPGNYTGTAGGWSYASAANSLAANSIQVTAYDVHGGSDYVGIDGNLSANPRTAGFAVKLVNAPAVGTVHWLQVIDDNNAIYNNASHPGTNENIIDIGATTTTPYYDTSGAADAANFFDAPRRPDVTSNNFWLGDLYVATGPAAPGAVTIYNGVAYGWANIFISAANIAAFANAMNNNLANISNLDAAVGTSLDSYYDPTSLQTLDNEFNSDLSELPEPSSLLVFVGIGIPVMMRRRRSKAGE